MTGQKAITSTFYEPVPIPPPPIPDYIVIGNGGPVSPNGNYFYTSDVNGKPAYRRTDGLSFIWWYSDVPRWIINNELGVLGAGYWFNTELDIVFGYENSLPFTGNPEVEIGV